MQDSACHCRPEAPYVIASEAEALVIAQQLADEFAQTAAERDRLRQLPWDEIERYTASGLGAITIPKAYGGLEASNETLVQVFAILSAADPSLGQIPQNHFALIQNLKDTGTDAQKAALVHGCAQRGALRECGAREKGQGGGDY